MPFAYEPPLTMFQEVKDAEFVRGEHSILKFWDEAQVFRRLRDQNAGKPRWSFLDGPITANNPMGVHHAWGRTYKDCYQRFFAMTGHDQRFQNGFDCQGLWVEVEVEKELGLGTKTAINEYGIDKFVNECKKRVLRFAARQTEQSVRLGYWMDWDDADQLRLLSEKMGSDDQVDFTAPSGATATAPAHQLVERLGCPEWGGSYFTFSTENNETIWTFLKKCATRGKIYQGHDVMPWSGRGGSAYSQMEIAEGRKLTTHKSVFVRFPLRGRENEFLLVWTTTPWTLTSNVAAAVNPDLDYVHVKTKRDGAVYYFAKDNLNFQRLATEYKEGFGRPEWKWPKKVPKLKTIAQLFKEQGGFEEVGTIKGAEMVGWEYDGPFDDLPAQQNAGGFPIDANREVKADNWTLKLYEKQSEFLCSVREELLALSEGRTIDGWPFEGDSNATWSEVCRHAAKCVRSVLFEAFNSGFFGDWFLNTDNAFSDVDNVFRFLGLAVRRSKSWQWLAATSMTLHEGAELVGASTPNTMSIYKNALTTFDELFNELGTFPLRTAVSCHRVIDGGRDSRGNAHVVAGEGTGIVHIAPGCGDVDHKLGAEHGLVGIAPLCEDGRYDEGFGDFTGREAIDPETAELVFENLKENGNLVATEVYPHIYPHCWRTGDELIFRLVDEWFINMDWREEIKDVTRQIRWLPDSIDGQNRECEWLSNMSDWMISKKRFWGLALPIWVNEEDPTDFEVMGSLAEMKERAVEGWDEFEGNTPHRPWIDGIVLESTKHPGQKMRRIEDVGNPWLDAGIVPFSTMHYNHDHDEWKKWYPADLVTECFPGQFRNWFYSLLSLSTMMRYDETEDAKEKRPFKTLLGHRLVQDETGNPMHKTDGTAIWFEEAAEQLGVDTVRWMYLVQNPSADLRFGTRHKDETVTLETPDGPISETKEGVPCCKVTSQPADEVRRRVLIPLWNSYAFFVNYARLDEFDPNGEPIPVADRPEIDRWVLSNLQALLQIAHRELPEYNVAEFCRAAEAFLDDLSNWYIRRNRRRFWRSKDASDTDKTAAYQTLYTVLVTLCKALAPCIPFLTERMYQNLVGGLRDKGQETRDLSESVHLCEYPQPDEALLDPTLNSRTATAQLVVKLGHKVREERSLRVRQPLSELRFASNDGEQREAIEHLGEVIREELNIKTLTSVDNLDDLVSYSFKPNLKTVGPKYGKLLGVIRKELPNVDPAELAPLRSGQSVTMTLDGNELEFAPEDVMISTEQSTDWSCADDSGVQIAISTVITPKLEREGMTRDFVRQVQQLRKNHNLQIQDRIEILYRTTDEKVVDAIVEWQSYIREETLANSIERSDLKEPGAEAATIGSAKVFIWLRPV